MLLVFQSIIVYGLIIWVMTYFGYVAYKSQYPQGIGGINMLENKKTSLWDIFSKSYFFIPIFVFCLFAALRYRVGVDCESYKEIFYEFADFGEVIKTQDIEILFLFLIDYTLAFTNTHYLLFFILALLQIGLYYFALRRERHALVFFAVALLLSGEYWSWMNGVRQNIAACAFVAIIPFIIERKWIYITLIILAATLMHKSAYILFPLSVLAYFLRNKIPKKFLQLGLLALCFVMMNRFNDIIIALSYLAEYAGYNEKSIDAYSDLEETTRMFGFRMFLLYTTYFIAILYSDKMFNYFKSQTFNICYNLFFIGICIIVLFYNNFTIIRINYYLVIFIPAIVSYFLFYLYQNKKYFLFFSILIMLSVRTLYDFYSALKQPIIESILYKFDF